MIQRQKGAILVLTAVMLPVLLAFMGLAVDLAHLYAAQAKLQNAADAAALAGGWNASQVPTYIQYNMPGYTVNQSNSNATKTNEINYSVETGKKESTDDNGVTFTVTLHEKIDTIFLRLINKDKNTVSLTASATAQIVGEDRMFQYAMAATDGIDAYESANTNNTIRTINNDIYTGGKINFYQYTPTYRYGYFNGYQASSIDGNHNNITGNIEVPPGMNNSSIWNNNYTSENYNSQNTHTLEKAMPIGLNDPDPTDSSKYANQWVRDLINSFSGKHISQLTKNGIYYQSSQYDALNYIGKNGKVGYQSDGSIIYNQMVITGYHEDINVGYDPYNYQVPPENDYEVYVSLHGDIHLSSGTDVPDSPITYRGVLYAPEGTVYIDGPWDFHGIIIAKKIVLNSGYTLHNGWFGSYYEYSAGYAKYHQTFSYAHYHIGPPYGSSSNGTKSAIQVNLIK